MENVKELTDANGNVFSFEKEDFSLVQSGVVLHDAKFETKPTTYAVDAFRRFCKNKSSIVGAIIILILAIMAIIVPIANTHDIKSPHPYEKLIGPKVFSAGTGFWDGTEEFKGIDASALKNYVPSAIINLKEYEKDGVALVDFTYDRYEATYGVVEMVIPKTYLNRYISQGLCEFSNLDDIATFKMLSDDCPVKEIVSLENGAYTAKVCQYQYLGYKTMPKFIFGTDNQGKDIFKLAFAGLFKSLIFACVISLICFSFGLVWGAVSGYFGGNVDLFMERISDVLSGVPTIVIVTLCRLHLGDKLSTFVLALCLTGWIGTAARTRTQFYRFKGREYVLASRTLGASDTRLIFRHILPNALGTLVTSSVLMIPGTIFTETSLAYLGLGLTGGDSFGTVLSDNQAYLGSHPMLIIFPSIIISLLMISFNLFGNGLRDALNPSLKGSD